MYQKPLKVLSYVVEADGYVSSVRVRADDGPAFHLINGSSCEGIQLPLNIGFMTKEVNVDDKKLRSE